MPGRLVPSNLLKGEGKKAKQEAATPQRRVQWLPLPKSNKETSSAPLLPSQSWAPVNLLAMTRGGFAWFVLQVHKPAPFSASSTLDSSTKVVQTLQSLHKGCANPLVSPHLLQGWDKLIPSGMGVMQPCLTAGLEECPGAAPGQWPGTGMRSGSGRYEQEIGA